MGADQYQFRHRPLLPREPGMLPERNQPPTVLHALETNRLASALRVPLEPALRG